MILCKLGDIALRTLDRDLAITEFAQAIAIDPAGRDRIARGIADGIAAYLADVSRAKAK